MSTSVRSWLLAGMAALPVTGSILCADPPAGPGNTDARRPRIEIVRGTETTTVPRNGVPQEPLPETVDRTAEIKLLGGAQRTAGDLQTNSADAFNRGLMPLRDYLEQTSLVLQIDLMSAEAHNADQTPVWSRQVERLSDACERLRLFNQPAAEGWAADLALAEWALADAEYHLAKAQRNASGMEQAALRRSDWAAEHVRRREWDVNIGAAPESSLARATGLLALAERNSPEQGSELVRQDVHEKYVTQLANIQALTQEWAVKGAGIGRADRVLEADVALDLEHSASRDSEGKLVLNPDSVQAADTKLHSLFDSQLDFYNHGTAGLYDLSRTCMVWRNLHTLASTEPDVLDDDRRAARETALTTLQDLAGQTQDLRGRNAADVTFVDLLSQLDAVDAVQAEQRRGYLN